MKTRYASLFPLILAVPFLATATSSRPKSGLPVGQAVSAFTPTHVTGPDAGTNTCPVCKYGIVPAEQVWVTGDSLEHVGQIARALESSIQRVGPAKLKAFIIFVKPKNESSKTLSTELKSVAAKNNLSNVGLLYVDGPGALPIRAYRINTSGEVKNTVMVYHQLHVDANFSNFVPDKVSLGGLDGAISKACSR